MDRFASQLLEHGSLVSFCVDLLLALLLSQALAWYYARYAHVLANRRRFARMFTIVAVTTLMVIASVKASLALSLGLVGALSIVRFRTPIKEPEELAYVFLAVAIGIGLGAEQRVLTVVVLVVLLVYLWLRDRLREKPSELDTLLHVTAPLPPGTDAAASGERSLAELLRALEGPCARVDLRRVDRHPDEFHCSLLVELDGPAALGRALSSVQSALPGSTVSVIERGGAS